MITCKKVLDIVNEYKLGDVLELGISPYNCLEYHERGGNIGTWMKPKSKNEITNEDHDKIVIAIKLSNTNNMSYFKLCDKLISCTLLENFYFITFQNHQELKKRYFVKLQEYKNKIKIGKIFPIEGKNYIYDFESAGEEMFSDVPFNIELHNKICFFGLPAIFEETHNIADVF